MKKMNSLVIKLQQLNDWTCTDVTSPNEKKCILNRIAKDIEEPKNYDYSFYNKYKEHYSELGKFFIEILEINQYNDNSNISNQLNKHNLEN